MRFPNAISTYCIHASLEIRSVIVYRHGDVRQVVTHYDGLEVPIVIGRTAIAIGGAAILATVISFALLGNRYELVSLSGDDSNHPKVYKIDKRTGRTWLVYEGSIEEIKEDAPLTQKALEDNRKDQAIQLTRNYTFPNNESADAAFQRKLRDMKGVLRVYGWRTKKIDDKTYVVGYTYDKGQGSTIQGWIFEVNLEAGIVRDIDGDPDLQKKYANWAEDQKEP
jgi:hypothetical protein